MARQASIQYTLRGVPERLDRALREQARAEGVSVNQLALRALARGLDSELPRRDLSSFAGTLSAADAKAIGEEVRRQRRVDPLFDRDSDFDRIPELSRVGPR
jgi:hypothetical protein